MKLKTLGFLICLLPSIFTIHNQQLPYSILQPFEFHLCEDFEDFKNVFYLCCVWLLQNFRDKGMYSVMTFQAEDLEAALTYHTKIFRDVSQR